MAFNFRKYSEKVVIKPYEKMLIDQNKEDGLKPIDFSNFNNSLEEDRKNNAGDEIWEKAKNAVNKSAISIIEKQLNERKSYIPHRNNDGIPSMDQGMKGFLEVQEEYEKANKEDKRNTEFWDKYVGSQSDPHDITKISDNDQPSQLLGNYKSREDFRKENPSFKKASAKLDHLKDADAMLYHIYRSASEQNRDLNAKEQKMVNEINSSKIREILSK